MNIHYVEWFTRFAFWFDVVIMKQDILSIWFTVVYPFLLGAFFM